LCVSVGFHNTVAAHESQTHTRASAAFFAQRKVGDVELRANRARLLGLFRLLGGCMKAFVEKHWVIVSVLLGTLLVAGVFTDASLPSVDRVLTKHVGLFEAVVFTLTELIFFVFYFWKKRYRRAFLASLIIFLAVHVAGISLYSSYVGFINLWQWSIFLFMESIAFSYLYAWLVVRLHEDEKRT
jgi:hypothetical protein